jgi:hypothetical protein
MPVPEITRLSPTSPEQQVKAAVSSCIATEVKLGTPQDQAVAMCYSMVKEKTGKDLGTTQNTSI